jgi:uncharacterized membrane protein
MPKNHPEIDSTWPKLERLMPFVLIIGGIIGIISSFILTLDKIKLLENPSYIPNCNLNPIISCGSVLSSKEGSLFGFPNSVIGLAVFAVLITIGVALLAGARFNRWFWVGLQAGTVLGLAFVFWLFFQSVYVIQLICPYCIVTWIVVITTFWYLLQHNLVKGHIVLPSRFGPRITRRLRKHHLDILLLCFLVIAFAILSHFWYFFGKNI